MYDILIKSYLLNILWILYWLYRINFSLLLMIIISNVFNLVKYQDILIFCYLTFKVLNVLSYINSNVLNELDLVVFVINLSYDLYNYYVIYCIILVNSIFQSDDGTYVPLACVIFGFTAYALLRRQGFIRMSSEGARYVFFHLPH